MDNYKYEWCWDCNRPCVRVGKVTTCCDYIVGLSDSEYRELQDAKEWFRQNGPQPEAPTKEMIMNYIDSLKNVSEENRLINDIFGFKYGNVYWHIQQWIDKMQYDDIPSYEDICNHLGYKPHYDCKTGKDWAELEKKHVPDISGWSSLESFETDEIPWGEFTRRWKLPERKRKAR